MRILDTLFTLFRRRKRFDDMSAEIRAHLDEKVDALMARGMSRSDAMLAARRAFGRVTQIEEAGRDVWRVPALDEILADLGFGLRFLRRSPTFAAVAVLSLAIGIGANAAVFTVINALLLRKLPVPDPSALVVFARRDVETGARARSPSLNTRRSARGRRPSECSPTRAEKARSNPAQHQRPTRASVFTAAECRAISSRCWVCAWRSAAHSFQ